jgi:fructokinase
MTVNHQNTQVVYALGETVLDLVSDGGNLLRAVPGGSVLNAAVSLGRMGIEVQLISESGDDNAGNLIVEFLQNNAVKTDFYVRNTNHKTSLALAFLDKFKNATYSFYHDIPQNLGDPKFPDFAKSDILLFGSFYSVKPDRRDFVLQVLKRGVKASSLIYYDLNIRKAHSAGFSEMRTSYLNNIASATIVKGSDEDFENLFGISDPEKVYEKINPYCKILIITAGAKPLHVFTPAFFKTYHIPVISPVSTIGAGDNFNAGFIFGLTDTYFSSDQLHGISVNEMDRLIGCGLAFATEACLSAENYIAGNFKPEFWKKYI